MRFNPVKNESMLLSRKRNKPYHPPLFMQNHKVTKVESHKHVGIYFSSDCSWHQHIEYIKQKAWTRINIMRKLKFRLDRKALETFYLVFIRPILEYGDVIWDNCTQYQKNELDKILYEAGRIAIGATKLISLNALYKETNWETLSQRRETHKVTLFYKMINQLTPNYLSSLVPQPVGPLLVTISVTRSLVRLLMLGRTSTFIPSYLQLLELGIDYQTKSKTVTLLTLSKIT